MVSAIWTCVAISNPVISEHRPSNELSPVVSDIVVIIIVFVITIIIVVIIELLEICWYRNNQLLEALKKFNYFLFRISGFRYFFHFWLYLGSEQCCRRSAGVKTTVFFRAFQLTAWVTWPELPKGAKDEVKRPEGPLHITQHATQDINAFFGESQLY